MQIHRDDMIGTGNGKHVGDKLSGYWCAALKRLVYVMTVWIHAPYPFCPAAHKESTA